MWWSKNPSKLRRARGLIIQRYYYTYQVVLSAANAIGIVNTYCTNARVRNRSTSKTQNCFSSFLSEILFRDNSVIRQASSPTVKRKHCTYILRARVTKVWNSYALKSHSKRTERAPAAFFQPSVILLVVPVYYSYHLILLVPNIPTTPWVTGLNWLQCLLLRLRNANNLSFVVDKCKQWPCAVVMGQISEGCICSQDHFSQWVRKSSSHK